MSWLLARVSISVTIFVTVFRHVSDPGWTHQPVHFRIFHLEIAPGVRLGPQEHRVERRLAAIFAADVAGYSRLMGQDEVGTLRTLTACREIMDRLIVEHGGRIANTAGDSVLAEFPSAVDAVRSATQIQSALALLIRIGPRSATCNFVSEFTSAM